MPGSAAAVEGWRKMRARAGERSELISLLRLPILCLSLAGVSGALGFASFPRWGQGYLAWIAFVPLLIATWKARSAKGAFTYGLAGGILQWALLMAWIPQVMIQYGGVSITVAWLLLTLLAAVLAAYQAFACAATKYCMLGGGDRFLMLFPCVWVALEAFRNYLILDGFPWLLIGYSQTDWLPLIQISDITGIFGISFLVTWINTALAWLLLWRANSRSALLPMAIGCMLWAGCLLYGHTSLKKWSGVHAPFNAALLQGNLAFDTPPDELAWKSQQGYLQMAARIEGQYPDLIVLPESPASRSFQFDTDYRRDMQSLARPASIGLILNNVHYLEAAGPTRYYNSAYFVSPDGKSLARYDKIHLVPFGEYIPWRRLFFFVETVSRDVAAFSPGSDFRIANLGGHRLNALICFEAIFPQLARRFVRAGSQLIVNLTNDRWYGDSAAPYQHLQMARWRAVENRRFLLRAANSGISAVVEPTGVMQSTTGLLREDVCISRFGFIDAQTFYSRHGDVFAVLCAIITLAVVGKCFVRRSGIRVWSAHRRGGCDA